MSVSVSSSRLTANDARPPDADPSGVKRTDEGSSTSARSAGHEPSPEPSPRSSVQSGRPSTERAAAARDAARHDPSVMHRRAQLDQALPASSGGPRVGAGHAATDAPSSATDATVAAQERSAAQARIDEVGPADKSAPYSKFMQSTRDALKAKGLPMSADGVPMFVTDSGTHAGEVVRAAAGKDAPGRGAAVRLKDEGEDDDAPPKASSIADLTKDAAEDYVDGIKSHTDTVRDAVRAHQASGDPRLATLTLSSSGTSIAELAGHAAESAAKADKDSLLGREVRGLLGHDARAEGAGSEEDRAQLEKVLADRLKAKLDTPEFQRTLAQARGDLQSAVDAANKANVLPIVAAGNSFDAPSALAHPHYAASSLGKIRGELLVGATTIPDPQNPAATRMAEFSAAAPIDIAAPGVQMPVAKGKDGSSAPTELDGTSYAAPFVAGTIALMTKAHPGLTAQQAQEILRDTARPVPGTGRDGSGAIDVVAAVERARQLAASRTPVRRGTVEG